MNEKETKTFKTSVGTSLQIHNTLDSQWRRIGTYCNYPRNFGGDSLFKSAHDQTSDHKVVWTVGDRLRLPHVPLINSTKTKENSHVKGRESNFPDVGSMLENGAMGLGKERKGKAGNDNQEAEKTLAFGKLQDAQMTASVALREAIDAREQTLQARKEALAARRESVEAQKEAMKARSEALMIRRETSEARRTLTNVTKAITAMLEEVQEIHTEVLGKILDQRAHKYLQKKCVVGNENEIDTTEEIKSGVCGTKKVLFDKDNQEQDEKALLNSLSLLKSNGSKSPLVVEPHIIITNSQTIRTKHACHTVPDKLSRNNYSQTLSKTIPESSHHEKSPENFNIALSKVQGSDVEVITGACIDVNVSCKDTDLGKHMKLPGTGDVHSNVKQNIGDPTKNYQKDSTISRRIADNDSISKESDDSDDLSDAEEKNLEKSATEAPGTGSFVQKWGDFIGRISTLMITIVTAVNTGEALVDSILAASFVKAGTFAFLLLCIHLPVAAVMIWLLLKEKVQQIKNIIGKAKAVLPFLFRVAKRSVRKVKSHGSLLNEEIGETAETTEELEPRDNNGSIFVVGTQRSLGVINEAFTDATKGDGCNPTST